MNERTVFYLYLTSFVGAAALRAAFTYCTGV
jgi:hypothetical protein